MRQLLWCGLLSTAFAVLQAPAAGPATLTGEPDPAKIKARLLAGQYLEGELTIADPEEKRFGLQVTEKYKVPNPKVQQQLTNLQQQYAVALTKRNNQGQIANLARQISDAQTKLYDEKEATYDFDLKGADKLVVRTLVTPVKDDGSKYSNQELQKMRGTSGLTGYPARTDDLTKGTLVRAYLDRNKLSLRKSKDEDPYSVLTFVIQPAKDSTAPPKKKN